MSRIIDWIKSRFRSEPTYIYAGYDAVKYSAEDKEHWRWCDSFSPDAAASPDVRRVLRERCRYEVSNNSYAEGAGNTLAEVTVGLGPKLNISTPSKELNADLEEIFDGWFREIGLCDKLAQMVFAKYQDGEVLGRIVKNYGLSGRLCTDLTVLECDRLRVPYTQDVSATCRTLDGIELDAYGNPATYWITKEHPGSTTIYEYESIAVPAQDIVHYFDAKRPEQHRGVPELTTALKLFAQLRRVTLAVATAFETAADVALLLHTDIIPPNERGLKSGTSVPIRRGQMMVLQAGWEATQVKAEHPTTTFPAWKREMLGEIGRCVNMPVNIITGDSSGYNFASGRLDQQVFFKSIDVRRGKISRLILDRLLRAGWSELVSLALGGNDPVLEKIVTEVSRHVTDIRRPPRHDWCFDNLQHVDPQKEESARKQRLANGVSNLQIECAKDGHDWEAVVEQRALEMARQKELEKKYGLENKEEEANGGKANGE